MIPPSPEPAPAPLDPSSPVTSVDPAPVRLELKPNMTRAGHVDGGWWPHSRDLRADLPGLLDALTARLGSTFGPLLRIGFGIAEWGPVGHGRLVTATGRVAFGGFTTFDSDVVWLSGQSTAHTPIVLLVVPPDAPEQPATAALRRAATAGNTERPDELLAGVSATSSARASRRGADAATTDA